LGFSKCNHIDFLPPHAAGNAQYCSNLLLNDVHAAILKKKPKKLSEGNILLHDNACLHMASFTVVSLGWEILNHLP
jgi:hypothetical protein